MVYKWAALMTLRRASVSKDIGCRYRGSDGEDTTSRLSTACSQTEAVNT
jgi:hypothetical protein